MRGACWEKMRLATASAMKPNPIQRKAGRILISSIQMASLMQGSKGGGTGPGDSTLNGRSNRPGPTVLYRVRAS
ncbi:hypothetical protein GCM10009830_08130 [Glycomyces endophyticus]|uniref:Uncharacterized protein n=1 Tax=Glycomyces endophyticus TaxID=480996 RepID=A0ABP4S740_9ACTN